MIRASPKTARLRPRTQRGRATVRVWFVRQFLIKRIFTDPVGGLNEFGPFAGLMSAGLPETSDLPPEEVCSSAQHGGPTICSGLLVHSRFLLPDPLVYIIQLIAIYADGQQGGLVRKPVGDTERQQACRGVTTLFQPGTVLCCRGRVPATLALKGQRGIVAEQS